MLSHDDTFEFDRLDRLDLDRALDGRLEQLFEPVLANGAPEPHHLARVAGRTRFVVLAAAEELPNDVLAPAGHEFLVAEIEAVLEVQQAGHQPDRQPRASGVAHTAASFDLSLAEQVVHAFTLCRPIPPRELRRQGGFDAIPRQPRCQHRERVVRVDHAVEAGAEKVWRAHGANPPGNNSSDNASWGIWWTAFTRNLQDSCGLRANCRADYALDN